MPEDSRAPRTDRALRTIVYAAVALSVLLGSAALFWRSELERWIANDVAGIGGPFALVDQNGRPFTDRDLRGHPHVLYFGFTYCPDICPTTLFQLASVVKALGARAAPLRVVFVTVDPERDTVEVMKQYVSAFDPRFIGLTGSAEALAKAAKAYRVYYQKVDVGDGDYTIEHTASAMLFDADGRYAGSIGYAESDDSARDKIERLLSGRGM